MEAKIGLILSGGGMRGMAHIGAIKGLEEHGIVPTHIAGSSMGAIVGALYAYGYSPVEMLNFFRQVRLFDVTKYTVRKPGFFDAEKFYTVLKQYLNVDNFNSLKKELIITATNILTGSLATFERGELIKPVLASAAFPGVFSPVKINNDYYIDGGVLNNFPVELLRERCDMLIGVYVNGYNTLQAKDLKHSYQVVERAFKIKTFKEDAKRFSKCDVLIYPSQLSKYGTFDKKSIEAIYQIGYMETQHELSQSAVFKTLGLPQPMPQQTTLKPQQIANNNL